MGKSQSTQRRDISLEIWHAYFQDLHPVQQQRVLQKLMFYHTDVHMNTSRSEILSLLNAFGRLRLAILNKSCQDLKFIFSGTFLKVFWFDINEDENRTKRMFQKELKTAQSQFHVFKKQIQQLLTGNSIVVFNNIQNCTTRPKMLIKDILRDLTNVNLKNTNSKIVLLINGTNDESISKAIEKNNINVFKIIDNFITV